MKNIKTSLDTYQVIRLLDKMNGVNIGNYEYDLDGDTIKGREIDTEEIMKSHGYVPVVRIVCSNGWVETQDTKSMVTEYFKN